jgi:hypothetical protein
VIDTGYHRLSIGTISETSANARYRKGPAGFRASGERRLSARSGP